MALRREPRERGSRSLGHGVGSAKDRSARGRRALEDARSALGAVVREQRKLRDELAASEAIYEQVFQHVPNALAIARTADAMIYDVNAALEQVSGFSRAEILGRRSIEFNWWPTPEEGEALLGKMAQQGYLHDVEMRILGRDGAEHYALVSASPITVRGEQCVVWHATDITERKRADEIRRTLEARLAKKQNLERLGTVAGAIAHDFNNLLVSVLGNADLVHYQLPEGSALRGQVQAIITSAQRAAEHTRELLDYAGRGGAKLRPLRLDQLLHELAELAQPVLRAEVRVCFVRSTSQPAWIHGDAGQLRRMFLNLVKNAADALEGRPGQVELALRGDALTGFTVTIRDQGQGMDVETSNRLFDPFFSAKLDGRGLGLISVPGIVERHEGSVQVTSLIGEGTTVAVTLPACAPPEDENMMDDVRKRPALAGRVLVVDDEPEVRSIASLFVSELGFEVVEADCGVRALELLGAAHDSYAWVLLDATMPGLDGTQVLERIRSVDRNLPVLLCSGYSRTDFTTLFATQPHVSFLTKPYRLAELRAAVEVLLDEASAQLPAQPRA